MPRSRSRSRAKPKRSRSNSKKRVVKKATSRKSTSNLSYRFHWVLIDLIKAKKRSNIKDGEEMYNLTNFYLKEDSPAKYSTLSASEKKKYKAVADKINKFASL